ncbi:MAG: 6-phosphogluconolactonase [Myxococcales bacterium]|nr:6-phosphogluconolactonase [Myxococcales bacterium]USN50058.1 MAG: 6-phosphogluconolactonase [Myxococcales bacterium]
MNTIEFETQEKLFQWAAKNFFKQANEALKHKNYFDVALSGGSTALKFFPYLLQGEHAVLKKTRWFFSDERVVGLQSEHSNAGQAWKFLIKNIDIDSTKQFFPMFSSASSASKAAADYQLCIEEHLFSKIEKIPVFDLIYLGMGNDGHTASLFPKSTLLDDIYENPALIAATKEPDIEHERITMMPRLILAAQEICVLTTGKSKLNLINEIKKSDYQPQRWPIQLILKEKHKNIFVLTSLE